MGAPTVAAGVAFVTAVTRRRRASLHCRLEQRPDGSVTIGMFNTGDRTKKLQSLMLTLADGDLTITRLLGTITVLPNSRQDVPLGTEQEIAEFREILLTTPRRQIYRANVIRELLTLDGSVS